MKKISIIFTFLAFVLMSVYSQEVTIFTTQTPSAFGNDSRYELGTKFTVNVNGTITKVRIYTNAIEGGEHIVRIWQYTGGAYNVLNGPHSWDIVPGTAGWKEFQLPTPVAITSGTQYIVSVSNSTDRYYSSLSNFFKFPPQNTHIQTVQGSGVYSTTLGQAPNSAYKNSAYFRDIVFVPESPVPGLPTVSDQSFCGESQVSALQGVAPSGCVIDWYTSSTGGSLLSGTTLLTTGTYYAESRNTVSGQVSASRVAFQVTINAIPASPTVTDQAFTVSANVADLIGTAPAGCVTEWYLSSSGGSPLASSVELVTGTYYAGSRNSISGCVSASRQSFVVTMNNLPSIPTVSDQSFCGETQVTALQGTAPAGCVTDWYTSASGGAALSGTTLLTTGTYYAESRNTVSGLVSASRVAFQVTINTIPSVPTVTNQVFTNAATVLDLTGTAPAGCLIDWYLASTGGEPLAPSTVLTSGTYYAGSRNSSTGCISATRQSFSVTIQQDTTLTGFRIFSDQVPATYSNDSRYELGTKFTVDVNGVISKVFIYTSAAEGGEHVVRIWQYVSGSYSILAGPYSWNLSSGTLGWREFQLPTPVDVSSGVTYVVSVSNSTDRQYPKLNNYFDYPPVTPHIQTVVGSGVYSTTLGQVPTNSYKNCAYFRDVLFIPQSVGSDLPVVTNQTFCGNQTVYSLQGTPPAGCTIDWYLTPTGGTALSSGTVLTTGTYYAESRNIVSGQVSTSRVSFVVTINDVPVSPTVTNQVFTSSTTVAGLAGQAPSGCEIEWFTGATGGTALTPATVLASGTYYAGSRNTTTGCISSARSEAVVTIQQIPTGNGYYIFSDQVPTAFGNDSRYELGTRFSLTTNGEIRKVRIYTSANEAGDHVVRIWEQAGGTYNVVSGPFTWNIQPGTQGWKEFQLPSALPVTQGIEYIVSVSNSSDNNYSKTESLFSNPPLSEYFLTIQGSGVYSTTLGQVPTNSYANSCYFRDVEFVPQVEVNGIPPAPNVSNQSFCGTHLVSDLQGTTSAGSVIDWYVESVGGTVLSASAVLSSGTYYAQSRNTTTGNISATRVAAQVTINVVPSAPSVEAQTFTGNAFVSNLTGTAPAGSGINWYLTTIGGSKLPVSTVLTSGTYYAESHNSTTGCVSASRAPALVTIIPDTTSGNGGSVLSNALVIVNSSASNYAGFTYYIKPYLDNFGIPYYLCDLATDTLPAMSNFAVIIFGHSRVYEESYPIAQIENAVSNGTGLVSFDQHLFDYASGFAQNTVSKSVGATLVKINQVTTPHYITQYHTPDPVYDPSNNLLNLRSNLQVTQNGQLVNGEVLANAGDGVNSNNDVILLESTIFGQGKIVRWNQYEWMHENVLGPLSGLDDLIWRGIVWAARKPFIMQGMPPLVTMRVDDVDGKGGSVSDDFEWVKICNTYGLKPWLGTFNSELLQTNIPTLKSLLDNGNATASPHAFSRNDFIYFNHFNNSGFSALNNWTNAKSFYTSHNLPLSQYIVPHFYEISSDCLADIKSSGCEFIAIQMMPNNSYYGTSWINCAPYRLERSGSPYSELPVYYGGYVNLNGTTFFNCLTEIRDDAGYEWAPDNDIAGTSGRGIRQLRRALNSMVLPSLFTHENDYIDYISITNWNESIRNICTNIAGYSPIYTTTDYAAKYIRAKVNAKLGAIVINGNTIQVNYSGNNDMATKFYLFTGSNGTINSQLIDLPQVSGNSTIEINQ